MAARQLRLLFRSQVDALAGREPPVSRQDALGQTRVRDDAVEQPGLQGRRRGGGSLGAVSEQYHVGYPAQLLQADGDDALGQLRSDDPALRIEEVAGDFGTSPLTPVPVAFPLAERVVDGREPWSPGADGDDRLGDPAELADRFDDARLLAQHAGCGAVRQEQWGVDGVRDAAGDES